MKKLLLIFAILMFCKNESICIKLKEKYGEYHTVKKVMCVSEKNNTFYLTDKNGLIGVYPKSIWAIVNMDKNNYE